MPMAAETSDKLKAESSKEEEEMKAWEQHSAVISIPRFNYKAPSQLLHSSHSAFLITCPFNREKSATKEAISILQKELGCLDSYRDLDCGDEDGNQASDPKRRKTLIENQVTNSADSPHQLRASESDPNMIKADTLSLVKLTRSGLVLFILRGDCSSAVIRIVSNIITSLETETTKPPLWCHRIFPIQATCSLKDKEIHAVVSRLVRQFMSDNRSELSEPVKVWDNSVSCDVIFDLVEDIILKNAQDFAVGYNRRGIEETELKDRRTDSSESGACDLLDRSKCFGVVAGAVEEVIPDSVVDLKCPEMCILIELLPVSAVSGTSIVVAVSVLPQKLVNLKPKLSIKPLISDAKVGNKK